MSKAHPLRETGPPMRTKGKAVRENLDLAFDVYCVMGGQASKTLAELERRGLRVSRPTLYDWIKKYRFEERRVRVEEERQRLDDARMSFEEKMLRDLLKQKERYERHFDSIDEIDNRAQYAYARIVRTVIELAGRIRPAEARDPGDVRRMAEEILRTEYGIERGTHAG